MILSSASLVRTLQSTFMSTKDLGGDMVAFARMAMEMTTILGEDVLDIYVMKETGGTGVFVKIADHDKKEIIVVDVFVEGKLPQEFPEGFTKVVAFLDIMDGQTVCCFE